jgi:hypothetical protein
LIAWRRAAEPRCATAAGRRTIARTVAAGVAEQICAARQAHPSWGPRMLLQWLARRAPDVDWPAPSTAGDLLARRGLVKKCRRRRPHYHPGVVAPVTHAPNDLWTADFKGHFRTRDGVYCYPLTIADQHTRYLLACQGLLSTKGLGVRSPLPPPASTGFRSSTSGGCGSAFSTNAPGPPRRRTTRLTSACTRR